MAIVKANYTRSVRAAKAAIRYIEHRPGKDGARIVRALFNSDGKVERREAYGMIDQAAKGSYFFRLVVSPDPQAEDRDRNLSLRDITERAIQTVEDRYHTALQWAAAIHADHVAHRHVHVLAIMPERLQVQDFKRMRQAASEAALEQVQHQALARQRREALQEELSW
jgi:hypothetical protein